MTLGPHNLEMSVHTNYRLDERLTLGKTMIGHMVASVSAVWDGLRRKKDSRTG